MNTLLIDSHSKHHKNTNHSDSLYCERRPPPNYKQKPQTTLKRQALKECRHNLACTNEILQ